MRSPCFCHILFSQVATPCSSVDYFCFFLPIPIEVHNLSYSSYYRTNKSLSQPRETKNIRCRLYLISDTDGMFLQLFGPDLSQSFFPSVQDCQSTVNLSCQCRVTSTFIYSGGGRKPLWKQSSTGEWVRESYFTLMAARLRRIVEGKRSSFCCS